MAETNNNLIIDDIKQKISNKHYILNKDELIELQLFLTKCFMNKDKNTINYIKGYLIYVNNIITNTYENHNHKKPKKVEKYYKFITILIDDIQYYTDNLK